MSLIDPWHEKLRRIDWGNIAFYVFMFIVWYFWPTEGL